MYRPVADRAHIQVCAGLFFVEYRLQTVLYLCMFFAE